MAKAECKKGGQEYSKPKLTEYGKVHELTKTNGPHGQGDGGAMPRNFTSL
jgi:hypothetical protein